MTAILAISAAVSLTVIIGGAILAQRADKRWNAPQRRHQRAVDAHRRDMRATNVRRGRVS